jgi:hypothetical protein
MIIREEQIKAFKQVRLDVFKEKMLVHLQEYFPEDCGILGEKQTKRVIDYGIAKAEEHGFPSSGDTCRYISLMFLLGSHCDKDPQIPWAGELLTDKNIVSPRTRMNLLYEKTLEYLGRIAGPNGEYYKRVLLKVRSRSFEAFTQKGGGDITLSMGPFLKDLYPQKYQELGEERVAAVTGLAQQQAGMYGLVTREGFLVYAGLMFLLGSHFDLDMLYPWAAAVLNDQVVTDPELKGRKLFNQTISMVEQYIALNRSMRSVQ